MNDQTKQESLSVDQARLLAHVTATEQDLGAGIPGADPAAGDGQADTASAAAENLAILQTLVAILTPAMPFLQTAYTPETIARIANAYTAVEEKYGWNVRGMMGVEVQLAIVVIPPTIQAVVLGKAYFAAKKREAEKVIDAEETGGATDGSQQ